MRKFYGMIGATLLLCLVLVACERVWPMLTVRLSPSPTTLALTTPAVTPPALPTLATAPSPTGQCLPRPGAVWHSWLADQNPMAVYTLLTDHDTVWAGTSLGVRRINTQTDAYVAYEDVGNTQLLLPIADGQVWAASKRGLFYFNGSHWIKPEMTADDTHIYQLGMDRAGDLHVFSSSSRYPQRYHYVGHIPPLANRGRLGNDLISENPTVCEQWQTATTGSYTHRSPTECDALNQARWKIYRRLTQAYPLMAIDADQSVWWAVRNILGHLSDNRSISLTLPAGQIYALAPDPEHGVWIGTDRGLAYSDENTLRWISLGLNQCTLQGIPTDIAVDTRGVAWLLTANGEVQRLAPGDQNWTAVTELRASAQGRPVFEIGAAPGGGIWITHGYDLQRFDGTAIIQSTIIPTYTYGMHILFVDPAGIVWNLSSCSRHQFNPYTDQWTGYDLYSLHKPCDLTVPVMARDGSHYAMRIDGLIAYTRTQTLNGATTSPQAQLIAPLPNLDDRSILAGDKQGGVWIASCHQHALWHYQNGKLTLQSRGAEWMSLGDPNVFCPRQLYVDDRDRLWISVDGRLIVSDRQTFRSIPLSVGTIAKLTSGPDGRIWVIGDKGVGIYDPAADRQP